MKIKMTKKEKDWWRFFVQTNPYIYSNNEMILRLKLNDEDTIIVLKKLIINLLKNEDKLVKKFYKLIEEVKK
jgi:hypothetical protein